MNTLLLPDFARAPLARADVLRVAQSCVGLPYSDKGTYVEWSIGGWPRGNVNCFGLLFVVAARLGLVDAREFWRAFGRAVAQQGTPLALASYLRSQLRRVEPSERRAGDILLFRWKGDGRAFSGEEEATERALHHVAFDAGDGWIIHAQDTAPDRSGAVFATFLNAHDWPQLHQVWTLPQYDLPPDLHEAGAFGEVSRDG